jgi:hypothetical protein
LIHWDQVLTDIIAAFVPVLATAVTALISFGAAYLRQRYNWARETHVVEEIEKILQAVVLEAQQTLVDNLKSANAEGKLTPAEANMVKQKVLARANALMTAQQHKTLRRCTSDPAGWLSARVEETLVHHKNGSGQRNLL